MSDLQRSCLVCGRRFIPTRKEYMTCSGKCGCRIRGGRSRTNRIPVPCEQCEKIVMVNPYRRSHCRNIFCSNECRGLFNATKYAGSNNPNFKNAGIKLCLGCGAKFQSYSKKRKFCGLNCTHTYSRNHPLNAVMVGLQAELLAVHHAKYHLGYAVVVKMRASRGPYDLVAIKLGDIAFIQVKYTSETRPRAGITPRTIEYLKTVPSGPGITRQFWVYVEGEGWRITHV